MTALALAGWAIALALAASLSSMWRRAELVADAEHELRGAIGALTLGLEAGCSPEELSIDLTRARAGLDHLAVARGSARAEPASDAALAQALCNLVANALEHGGGRVLVRGRRDGGALRIEVADTGGGFKPRRAGQRRPGRGRGLRIAERAVSQAGGALTIASAESGSTVSFELPPADRAA